MKLKKIVVFLLAAAMAVAPMTLAACGSASGGGSELGKTEEGGNTEGGNTEGGNTGGSGNTEGGNNGGSGNTEGGGTEGGNTESGGNTETTVEYTITFNYNHDGMESTTAKVEEDALAEKPENPTCTDGHVFLGWYTDAEAKIPYTFKEGVTANLTLYASWYTVTEGKYVAVFNTNNAAGDVIKVEFESGTRWTNIVSEVTEPVWENHFFNGWYNEDGEQYSNLKSFNSNITLYAQWLGVYTIEAENTYIDPAGAHNQYSGASTGLQIIKEDDTENKTASNGYYVGDLWKKGETLSFEFYADKDDEDVILAFRLSAKYGGSVNTTGDQIFVGIPELDENGDVVIETVEDEYGDKISSVKYSQKYNYELNVPSYEEMSSTTRDFSDYTLVSTVKIKKGKNIIQFVINNSQKGGNGGTMNAIAPLVDCLKITTTSTIVPIVYKNTSK